MKIVTNIPAPAPVQSRAVGQVTEKDGQFFLCVRRNGFGPFYMVSLRDNTVAEATGNTIIQGERLCAAAEFYPDGVPPRPVPVLPVKSKEDHCREFIGWYWNNLTASGASRLTTYSVHEILGETCNGPTRRAFAAWLAARGV